MRRVIRAAAAVIAWAAAFGAAPPSAPFRSLVEDFDRMAMASATLPPAERVARFRAEIVPLLPDFYRPPRESAKWEAHVAAQIAAYPAERAAIHRAAALVEARRAGAGAGARFARAFPDYRQRVPVYLIHSLGQMDGGTRTIGGRMALLFGADAIARYHDARSIGPLFDHELFHTYHAAFFPECEAVYCQLWAEGLAVYVTKRLHPEADDGALLLTQPEPLRASVEPRLGAAACAVAARLDSKRPEDNAALFAAGAALPGWPSRMGYFLGLRVAETMARGRSPAQLAHLTHEEVRPALEAALRGMGDCR